MAALRIEQELTLNQLGLTSGLVDLEFSAIGGRSVLYALSRAENQLIELQLSNTGALFIANSLALTGTFAAGTDPLIDTVTLPDGSAFLTLGGMAEADGQIVALTNTGALDAQSVLSNIGPLDVPTALENAGSTHLISGRHDGGLNLFADAGSGFVWTSTLGDTTERMLGDVSAMATFSINQDTFVATTSTSEQGINIARIAGTSLIQASAIGPDEYLPLNVPVDIKAIQRFGETHLIVASSGSSSITTLGVNADGISSLSDHVLDSTDSAIHGIRSIDTVRSESFVYIAAGGDEGGISLFTMLPGGRLVHLETLHDSNAIALEQVSSIEMEVLDSALQIYSTSSAASSIARITYDLGAQGVLRFADGSENVTTGGGLDDQLIGSDVSDALTAGAGDDILLDGAGVDTLTGGAGADLFIMTLDGVPDVITDFEPGHDKLDLSAFEFLFDTSQITLTPEIDGATLVHGDEMIRIFTAENAPLTLDALTNDDILNVDRPSLLSIVQELIGGANADTLNGSIGNDTIFGNGGDDALFGSSGDDTLSGGTGRDQIDGGTGADTLNGHAGADTLVGSEGNDLIFGGDGDDVIFGDTFDVFSI